MTARLESWDRRHQFEVGFCLTNYIYLYNLYRFNDNQHWGFNTFDNHSKGRLVDYETKVNHMAHYNHQPIGLTTLGMASWVLLCMGLHVFL